MQYSGFGSSSRVVLMPQACFFSRSERRQTVPDLLWFRPYSSLPENSLPTKKFQMRLSPAPLISGISLVLLATLCLPTLRAAALPKPSLIPTPAELDIPYSSDNPPSPTFSEEEKRLQLVEGQRIRNWKSLFARFP